ncbi:MAG: flagellar hook-associated protein 3 [Lachnospiraceae bacterium]|nr:flagellar hook-associated protein 3 [Lachnospiraceae bacterium]
MRITNKIMQNNTLYNINQNKILQDKLNTQITTKKKVTKPSDDPVVAIRSLRLRSNLSQVSQYNEKNIPDAEQWLELTESAIQSTVDVVSNMITEFQRGSKSNLQTSDRAVILESLKQLRDEVYATGDSDFAGRTIFTGYRTDTKLSFTEDTTQEYVINEQITNTDIDTQTYVDMGELTTLNETNYNSADMTTEQEVEMYEIHRIRLAYENLDDGMVPTINQAIGYDENGKTLYQSLGTVTTMSANGATDPYRVVSDPNYADYDPDAIIFVPETGELLLGETAYTAMQALDPAQEIKITYQKSEWADNDLRPEHYFACSSNGIDYNAEYLTKVGNTAKQVIEYDVGFNQQLQVNTTADEVYLHGIGRAVDEALDLLDQMDKIDAVVAKLEGMVGNEAYDQDTVEAKLAAAKKAQTYMEDTLQKTFESGITEMQGYLDTVNMAYTTVGNRSLRLTLIENRLGNQQTAFETLTSENEDADIADLAVQLSSAELTYDAALAATGKLLQTSLMNYI